MSQQESSLKASGLATDDVVPDVSAAIHSSLSSLNLHASMDFPNVHGRWRTGTVDLYDQSGQWFDDTQAVYGRKVANTAAVVGIEGATWLMPCSTSQSGVPRTPYNVSFWTSPPNGHTAGDDPAPITLYCLATCLMPVNFQFEIKLSGEEYFYAMLVGAYTYDRPNCQFGIDQTIIKNEDTGDLSSTLTNPLYSSTISPTPVGLHTIKASAQITIGHTSREWSDKPGKVRCRISNSAAGGGVIYTPEIQLWFEDFTTCF